MHLALAFINTLLPVLSLAGKTHQPSALRSRHFKYANVEHVDARNVKRSDNITVSYSYGSNPPYHVETHYEGEDFFKYVSGLSYVSIVLNVCCQLLGFWGRKRSNTRFSHLSVAGPSHEQRSCLCEKRNDSFKCGYQLCYAFQWKAWFVSWFSFDSFCHFDLLAACSTESAFQARRSGIEVFSSPTLPSCLMDAASGPLTGP